MTDKDIRLLRQDLQKLQTRIDTLEKKVRTLMVYNFQSPENGGDAS